MTRKKFIRVVLLLMIVMNMRPFISDSLAARKEHQQTVGWTIERAYDEKGHFAGAFLYDEKGQIVDECYNELCVARAIQQRRLQLMTDSKISKAEREALYQAHGETAEKIRHIEASIRDLIKTMAVK